MDLGITVEGDRAVELKFETFPQDAHARLLERIADFTAELEAEITAAEPSRTGKLAAETRSAVYDEPERIAGRVAIAAEFGKAAALEYGAHGTTKVRAHEARLAHVFGRLISPITVAVGAHSRQLDIAEHRFLRGPLAAMEGRIVDGLRAALDEAAAG